MLEDSQESAHYELTRMRKSSPSTRIYMLYVSIVLEQAEPEVALVSSKAEDGCIDVMRSHSASLSANQPHICV